MPRKPTYPTDLTGMDFGNLHVLYVDPESSPDMMANQSWMCECACGTVLSVRRYNLLRGRSQSCGCSTYSPLFLRKHALLSGYWRRLKASKDSQLCEDWQNYSNFKAWALKAGYTDHLLLALCHIDDATPPFGPHNCYWAEPNKFNLWKNGLAFTNKFDVYNYKGLSGSIYAWAELLNLSRTTLRYRLKAANSDLALACSRISPKFWPKRSRTDQLNKVADEVLEYIRNNPQDDTHSLFKKATEIESHIEKDNTHFDELQNKCSLNSPVRWVRNRSYFLNVLSKGIPMAYGRYYEPFVGDGALLFTIRPAEVVMGDPSTALINMYIQMRDNSEDIIQVLELLSEAEVNEEFYSLVCDRYNEKILNGEFDAECAALMLWLDKKSVNGLSTITQDGLFNGIYNTRSTQLTHNFIKKVSRYFNMSKATIQHGDFEDILRGVQEDDFVFFNSPYIPVNGTDHGFSIEDHERLAEVFRKLHSHGAQLCMVINNVPMVSKLYKGFTIVPLEGADNITPEPEVIVANY